MSLDALLIPSRAALRMLSFFQKVKRKLLYRNSSMVSIMPDSITITFLDPKTDIHIGDFVFLHVYIQNIDQEPVILKDMQFRTDVGMNYEDPNIEPVKLGVSGRRGIINRYIWPRSVHRTPLIVYDSIPVEHNKVLQPGSQINRTLPFKAGGFWLKNIEPGKYQVVLTVTYEKKGTEYTKVEAKEITVYYNLWRMILGGIVGGILGVIYRDWEILPGFTLVKFAFDVMFGALVGLILVIILNRKSNVQSFISVNDFWGAVLAGLVAGALGKELISGYLSGITPAAPNMSQGSYNISNGMIPPTTVPLPG
jgi:hypothetical protein